MLRPTNNAQNSLRYNVGNLHAELMAPPAAPRICLLAGTTYDYNPQQKLIPICRQMKDGGLGCSVGVTNNPPQFFGL